MDMQLTPTTLQLRSVPGELVAKTIDVTIMAHPAYELTPVIDYQVAEYNIRRVCPYCGQSYRAIGREPAACVESKHTVAGRYWYTTEVACRSCLESEDLHLYIEIYLNQFDEVTTVRRNVLTGAYEAMH
jgi:hypothetical protein